MRADHHCRWVRHRLPLLAGGELGVEERRQVERHLIGCLGCRNRRHASTIALSALRAFAVESPVDADAPSLWPALATQIRQSRRVAARPSWWEIPLPRPWAAVVLASSLIGAVAVAATLAPPTDRKTAGPAPITTEAVEDEAPVLAFTPKSALPSDTVPRDFSNPVDPPSGLQFNYDLDHGVPMGPGNRDPQHSY